MFWYGTLIIDTFALSKRSTCVLLFFTVSYVVYKESCFTKISCHIVIERIVGLSLEVRVRIGTMITAIKLLSMFILCILNKV